MPLSLRKFIFFLVIGPNARERVCCIVPVLQYYRTFLIRVLLHFFFRMFIFSFLSDNKLYSNSTAQLVGGASSDRRVHQDNGLFIRLLDNKNRGIYADDNTARACKHTQASKCFPATLLTAKVDRRETITYS